MRITQVVSLAALLLLAPFALAGKVVVLNIEGAVLQTEAAKKAEKALKSREDFAALIAKAESLNAEIESLKKDKKTKSETWPADKIKETDKKLNSLSASLQEVVKNIQGEQKKLFIALMQEMQPKLKAIIDEIVTAEKIDLIVSNQAALWVAPSSDITNKVTEKLDKAK